jgi:hypothetical protein
VIDTAAIVNNENANISSSEIETKVIFGQNLTDRVVNAASPIDQENEQSGASNQQHDKDDTAASTSTDAKVKAPLWSSSNENEYAERNEIDDMNTILKINCKLYVLESDKANWAERGYGMLKLIDTPDETNCKIS